MVPVQPTNLWQFLGFRRAALADGAREYFYASWEDALWDVLKQRQVQQGAVALVPEFFCKDVVENMEAHGLSVEWYPVDENFQIDPTIFAGYLKKYTPSVVVILHAVGIENKLFSTPQEWVPCVLPDSILIEDSVHRILDPSKLSFIHPNHLVIDSLRKVLPLAGAHLFCSEEFGFTPSKRTPVTFVYEAAVLGWWLVFQMCLGIGSLKLGKLWQKLWFKWAERAMLSGYDVIGDSKLPGYIPAIFRWVYKYVDYSKIAERKRQQVTYYQQQLQLPSGFASPISFSHSDPGLLRGYPLRLELKLAGQFLAAVRDAGLLLRAELTDCPWSERQKVVYLPLGPHLSNQDIQEVAQTVNQAISLR